MRKSLPYRLLLTLTAVGITILSLMPETPDAAPVFPGFDKIAHTVSYFVLTFFTVGAFSGRRSRIILWSIVLCSAYGGILEILQGCTGRSVEFADFLFDILGSAAGGCVGGALVIPRSKT